MTGSAPVWALTFLGILIVLLGRFAAGNMWLIVAGLVAIAFAGVLQVAGSRKG